MAMLLLYHGNVMAAAIAAGCCISQEKINMSTFPMALQISFQPFSLHLAYPGLGEQCRCCEQQDNWCHEQDEEQYTIHIKALQLT